MDNSYVVHTSCELILSGGQQKAPAPPNNSDDDDTPAMKSFATKLCCCEREEDDSSDDDELRDKDALGLSHVGEAVHAVLGRQHGRHHHAQWNVTRGRLAGPVDDTPRDVWGTSAEPAMDNDDWFPQKMARIICRTEAWWCVATERPSGRP